MPTWAEVAPFVADGLVLIGLITVTIGVVGVFRMPDIFLKLHSTSVVVVLGVIAIALAALFAGVPAISYRIVLIVAILGITAPIATFSMARAAYLRGEAEEEVGTPDEPAERRVESNFADSRRGEHQHP